MPCFMRFFFFFEFASFRVSAYPADCDMTDNGDNETDARVCANALGTRIISIDVRERE